MKMKARFYRSCRIGRNAIVATNVLLLQIKERKTNEETTTAGYAAADSSIVCECVCVRAWVQV